MSKDNSNIVALLNTPTNESESARYAAVLATGNYPAGLDGCFTVGDSGGCGWDCYVFQDGKCTVASEVLEASFKSLDKEQKQWFLETYPECKDIFDIVNKKEGKDNE